MSQQLMENMSREQLLLLQKPDIDILEQGLHVTEQIIQGLSPQAILEVFKSCGSDKDIDSLFNMIHQETMRVLYGDILTHPNRVEVANLGYLNKLSDSVEEEMRCRSLSYFITSVLPYFEMNWHHYEWARIAEMYKKFCVLAARDHGKSFMYSNAYPAWMLYKYKPKTPQEMISNRGFLFSFSILQATDLMSILKDTIENTDILKERLYNKDAWSKTDITCKNRARLTVKGFGSAVRGAHPYWIMVDDGLKDNIMYSSEQNRKMIEYFHAVIENLLTPNGSLGLVGTPFLSKDLYGDLRQGGVYKCFDYPAIFPDGKLLWENRWNYEGLIQKRKAQGNLIFSREILVKPVTADSTIFPIEILNTAFIRMDSYTLVETRESFPIKFHRVVTGCDFAISGNVGSDYSVFLTFGIDDNDVMWLINAVMLQGASYHEQLGHLKVINSRFKPDVMVLEKNTFQQIFVEEATRAGLPVKPHTTTSNKNDLRSGLPSLAIGFERGMFRVPTGDQKSKNIADVLIQQFSSVAFTDRGLQGTSEHDDFCMAFWIAVEGARAVTENAFNFSMV